MGDTVKSIVMDIVTGGGSAGVPGVGPGNPFGKEGALGGKPMFKGGPASIPGIIPLPQTIVDKAFGEDKKKSSGPDMASTGANPPSTPGEPNPTVVSPDDFRRQQEAFFNQMFTDFGAMDSSGQLPQGVRDMIKKQLELAK